MFATASLVNSWILFEQPGAWGPDALTDSGFPESARSLAEAANRLGIRTLLIRRRNREAPSPVVYVA
ncbi:MAG TPA: sucrase ferredoxin, partial [Acidimicrobiia bacterium]|nr:sucrase ferredoxin [Acidimicrobiia bacterium]